LLFIILFIIDNTNVLSDLRFPYGIFDYVEKVGLCKEHGAVVACLVTMISMIDIAFGVGKVVIYILHCLCVHPLGFLSLEFHFHFDLDLKRILDFKTLVWNRNIRIDY